ncbi:MAG: DUF3810 family protein [Nanoarchaeota archaeon]|nr:DUF3810 family protein [Nanoarchaeota archaeon]MCG2718753.1 DUF3810 family protein [Nanoarchaeota archaeon]
MAKKDKTYKVPNLATYSPVSTSDIIIGGLGVNLACFAASFGLDIVPVETIIKHDWLYNVYSAINYHIPYYTATVMNYTMLGMLGSAGLDFLCRPRISRKKDVSEKLDAPRGNTDIMTRLHKIDDICYAINYDYTEKEYTMQEEAKIASDTLDEIIYKIEGVRQKTSSKVRNSKVMKYIFPHALGGCNLLSREIDFFGQMPYMSFSISAHELAHRKSYFKENDAEVLAHLAGFMTRDPVFIQSARYSRLRRECQTIFEKYDKHNSDIPAKKLEKDYIDFVKVLKIPDKMKELYLKEEFKPFSLAERAIMKVQIPLYKILMRIFGQKEGLIRYTGFFTEDLYALENKYGSVENLVTFLENKQIS